ncbi:MAG: acylphosphatase [Gammaproteobacteria bacterium]|nr:acylphosphatase [Gammaproteobacteria bacterium]MCF6361991.1 acylphosphatase [Gammaproteobacteria bacterium]
MLPYSTADFRMICRRCWVSGRVQGVWYRGSTRREAENRGVTGYARNLPDGRVEVLACGPQTAVDALCDWLWQGPAHAEVSDVQCEFVTLPPPADFTTG